MLSVFIFLGTVIGEIVFFGSEFGCGIPGSDCLVQLQCMVFTAGGGSEGVEHHTVLFLVISCGVF